MTHRFFGIAVGVFLATVAPSRAGFDCPVTRSNDPSGVYRNGVLEVYGLRPNGTVEFKPGGAGFIMRDGALAMKFGWQRLVTGKLMISGQRFDGDAPPLRARIPSGYGEIGFQSTSIVFPTPGCWQVTGQLGSASLMFVTRVVKIGEGPSGRGDW
jgi:hypothetical protein